MNNNRDPYNSQPPRTNAQDVNPVYDLSGNGGANFGGNPNGNSNGSPGGYSGYGNGASQQYETVTPDAVWDSVPGKQKITSRGPGSKLGIAGVICALLSIILSTLALLFAFLFYVGFIMNILSAVLAVVGIIFGAVGGGINSKSGHVMGGACIGAIILSVLALMISGILFACTGCAASFFCSRDAASHLLY